MQDTIHEPASVDGARSLFRGNSGRWAGEQLLRALSRGEELSPGALRSLDTLPRDAWLQLDNTIVQAASTRLQAVADLIAANLTVPLPNALGRTVFGYESLSDMNPASVSMDGMATSENDRAEFTFNSLPVPITHKDFFLNIRTLAASRIRNEPLDTTQAAIAGRKVAEQVETMLISGSKSFAGLPIYGYTTHPKRNTISFGVNGAWSQSAKTGDNILADVLAMIALAESGFYYGPYWLYVPRNASTKLETDFKANGSLSIIQRLQEIRGISRVEYLDMLPADNIILLQPTPDVVSLVDGEQPQSVQWDVNGGFGVNFKVFAIQVPLIRADAAGNSGIVHMS